MTMSWDQRIAERSAIAAEKSAAALERIADAFDVEPSPRATRWHGLSTEELHDLRDAIAARPRSAGAEAREQLLAESIEQEIRDRTLDDGERDWGSAGDPIDVVENLLMNLENARVIIGGTKIRGGEMREVETVQVDRVEFREALTALREGIRDRN